MNALRTILAVSLLGSTLVGCGDDTSSGEGGGAGQGGEGATTSSSSVATTGSSSTTTTTTTSGGPLTFDEACQQLCDAENAALTEAGCETNSCEDACRLLDRPGCEAEGAAVASCEAGLDISCTCEGNVDVCSYNGDCLDAYDAYDACEGECVQAGGGTTEAATAAFDAYCAKLADIAADAGCSEPVDCDQLATLYLGGIDGCEAEATDSFDCASNALEGFDTSVCTCENDNLQCPGLEQQDTCEAENDAFSRCNGCG